MVFWDRIVRILQHRPWQRINTPQSPSERAAAADSQSVQDGGHSTACQFRMKSSQLSSGMPNYEKKASSPWSKEATKGVA